MNAIDALRDLWIETGGRETDLDAVRWHGPRHALPAAFDVTGAAAAAVAAANLAAARLWADRNGAALATVEIDRRHAAIAFRSERYLRVDGKRPRLHDPVSGDYAAVDGRWVRLHASFPAHRDVACRVLGVAPERTAVAAAVAARDAAELEDAMRAAGGCAAMMRSSEEWRAHPQGAALVTLPPVEIRALDAAPPQPLPRADRPLEGVRVLDLTRVIAGPVCGRFLAACGADVLRITSPNLPDIETLAIDTGFGKRSAQLDLARSADCVRFEALIMQADVLVQSYRPGALERLGFAPARLAALRPGIVTADLSAYGRVGPWSEQRGFDSLVQMASGIAHAGAAARGVVTPSPLPAQALDHASGYLLAFGVQRALARRATEGGSRQVQVSLARTGAWLEALGHVDALGVPDPAADDVVDLVATAATPYGAVRHVRAPGTIAGASHAWLRPPVPAGTHPPAW
jgi:hypothetical protein